MGWQAQFIGQFEQLLDETQQSHYFFEAINTWVTQNITILVFLTDTAILGLILSSKKVSPAQGVFALMAHSCQMDTMRSFLNTLVKANSSVYTIAGIQNFIQSTPDEEEEDNESEVNSLVPPEWPQSGAIHMDGVKATYM